MAQGVVFSGADGDVLVEPKKRTKEKTHKNNSIILYNDEVNTFDFVIDALIEVCNHDAVQAEQCTFIIHYKGKCDVKSGSYKELTPVCSELLRRGLTAEIE